MWLNLNMAFKNCFSNALIICIVQFTLSFSLSLILICWVRSQQNGMRYSGVTKSRNVASLIGNSLEETLLVEGVGYNWTHSHTHTLLSDSKSDFAHCSVFSFSYFQVWEFSLEMQVVIVIFAVIVNANCNCFKEHLKRI